MEKDREYESKHENQRETGHEPTIAPGMNTHDPLEEKATEDEVHEGDSTLVTRLYLDRTPEE
ncbi:hypothetical protein ACFQ88_32920 [Paenibacillus sp. NPDC056579]|uniref:hypothetical protein n=1 Tax=unclassified Paenibacillus TaxID=185978 RepID=UPI001EF9927C|nr:hypothetical protein [Paenibacillus sp. H1-7]ULL18828.1 hypothetical protein DVH26_32965 [Paenibacillus sp. H1-7]